MILLRKRSSIAFLTIFTLLFSLLMPFSAFAGVSGTSVLTFDPATKSVYGVVYSTQPTLKIDAKYSLSDPSVSVYEAKTYSSVNEGVYRFNIPSTIINGLPVSLNVYDDVLNKSGAPSVTGNTYEYHFAPWAPKLHLNSSSSSVSLNWPKVPGADYYRVYRSVQGQTEAFSQIGTVTYLTNPVTYQDVNVSVNHTYNYRVTALNSVGESVYSNTVQAVIQSVTDGSGTVTGATVSGTISAANKSFDAVHLFIRQKEVSNSYRHTIVSPSGHFIFDNLQDGTYIVDGYYDNGWNTWTSLPIHPDFTVQDGQLINGPLSIVVPSNNVNGTIQLGSQPLNGQYLNLHSTTTQNAWFSTKIANGSFSLYLPDGSYSVDGYSDPGTYQFHSLPIKVTFTVTNGHTDTLSINIPANNVTGTVHQGNQAITNAWLSIRSDEAVPQWKSARIDNGAFQTYLPDGKYEVTGITNANGNFKAYRVPFTVTGGQLQDGPLQIDIPIPNISGTVTYGGSNVTKGWLSIHSVGNDSAWFQAKIDNGTFQLYLPDGSYEAVGYSGEENSGFVPYKLPFTVRGGQASPSPLNIQIPANNVSGTIKQGTTPIAKGWLSLRSGGILTNWYSAKVENGQFSLYLPDGKYHVNGVTDPVTGIYTELDYSFEVNGGQTINGPLDIVIRDDNVTGTIIFGTTPVSKAWLDIQSSGETDKRYHAKVWNGNFSLYLPDGSYEVKGYSSEGSDQYQAVSYNFNVVNGTPVPLQLAIVVPANNVFGSIATQAGPVANAWIMLNDTKDRGLKYTTKIKGGQFEFHLPDGTYRVAGYYDQQDHSFHQVDYTFTVSGGVSGPNPLSITVPAQNVTGTVVLNNQAVNSGWVNIYSQGNGSWHNAKISNGAFNLYLPDGQYKASGYWDDQGQVFRQLDTAFTVSQGQTQPAVLTFTVPSVTLQGSLKNNDGTPVSQAWIIVKNTSTNETSSFQTLKDGSFSSRLPIGTYKVLGYSFNHTWYSLYKQTFSITGENLASPLSLQLNGYPVVFTGTVTQDGQALSKVWVLLKDNSGDNYYVQTDAKGTYSARIPSGNYTLIGVYLGSQQGWYSINQTLTSGSEPVTQNIEVKVAGQ